MSSKPIEFQNTKNLLVTLALDGQEGLLMQYAAFLTDLLPIEKVIFLHIIPKQDFSSEFLKEYPDISKPAYENINAAIEGHLEKHFKPKKHIEATIEIVEGNIEEKVLKFSNSADTDIIIFGRKDDGKEGSMADGIAHKVGCHALFVPDAAKPEVKKIVVAVDFSQHAELSIRFAQSWAEKSGATVEALHVYSIPSGYHKSGKSYEEFAQIMEQNAKKDFQYFLKKTFEGGTIPAIPCHYALEGEQSKSALIYYKSKELHADLILVGSKGRTATASVLFGSVAEKVLRTNMQLPLLIIRKKGEALSFLKALLNL